MDINNDPGRTCFLGNQKVLFSANELILSLFFGEHDSCITISDGEKILLHLEAERVFRVKHIRISTQQMERLVAIGLCYLKKTISDVGCVLLAYYVSKYSNLDEINLLGKNFKPIITYHHLNHIGVTLPANFNDALIICADGGSEDGLTKVFLKKKNKITLLDDLSETILTGRFYGTITQVVIDPNFEKANVHYPGKTMGLAALGTFSEKYYNLITKYPDVFRTGFFYGSQELNKHLGISNNYDKVWLDKKRCDLAYTAQKIWCDKFLEKISEYKHLSENFCFVGGCALNVVLNTALVKTKWFKNVYISPLSGDYGQSLGAILFNFPGIKCEYPFLGREFGNPIDSKELVSSVVRDLMEEKIVAWFQGRSCVGARALGHRSFLGLPNSIKMRVKLSEKVKGREPYRPVAAILTNEFLPKFTSDQVVSPFMTFAPQVNDDIKSNTPAIVHFDGTCRVQTLTKDDNPLLYKILKEIGKRTGYPVLMNSSFNIAGEPIVDTPEDALNTYKKSNADILYINGKRYEK